MNKAADKTEIFSKTPVRQALFIMAVPTIISQMINLIYNIVDTFFIGRTGNSYMVAATTIALTLFLLNISLSNLFGIGGGSLVSRLMGAGREEEAERVSAFSLYGAAAAALLYSLIVFLFLDDILIFLGASEMTLPYARSYSIFVIIIGSLPCVLSQTLAHLLRNVGYSKEASMGLSGGGILNVVLDPLFMFVIMPKGQEIAGAAIATLISNIAAMAYLLFVYIRVCKTAPISADIKKALEIGRENLEALFSVGIPSALLTGLLDVANMYLTILAAAHGDLVVAGIGIVMKVERVPNAINIGLCQGMLPIVAYNYAAGNHERMKEAVREARKSGLVISLMCIVLFQLFASQVTRIFLNTGADSRTALETLGYAVVFLRIRSFAAPFQLVNYHSSFCMQAMGNGKGTLLHAFVRDVVFYMPLMYMLDRLFSSKGLAAALPAGEFLGGMFALYLLESTIKKHRKETLEV